MNDLSQTVESVVDFSHTYEKYKMVSPSFFDTDRTLQNFFCKVMIGVWLVFRCHCESSNKLEVWP